MRMFRNLGKKRQYVLGMAAVFVLALLFLIFHYGTVLFSPNDAFFSVNEDGFKNYFNIAYHIKHDTSFQQSQAMNHPFGETISFIDCQPVLANTLKLLAEIFPSIADYTIGIMNLFMLLSLLLCAMLLYDILKYYEVSVFVSVLGAISIMSLSSHVLLWTVGHYALSYQWVLPFVWILLLREDKSKLNKHIYFLCIGLAIFILFRLHVYLGFSAVLFLCMFKLLEIPFYKKSLKDFTIYLPFLYAAILPLVLQMVIMMTTDTHERINPAHTNLEHRASFWNVFLPNKSITKSFFELFFDFSAQKQYSWSRIGSYVGIPSLITIVYIVFYFIKKIYRKQFPSIKKVLPYSLLISIISATVILLYSMAVLHKIGMGVLFDHISFSKQILGLGRFAWIFFYIITITSLVFFSRVITSRPVKYTILSGFIVLFYIEGDNYHRFVSERVVINENTFNERHIPSHLYFILSGSKIDFSKYQAIIALPFYYQYFSSFNKAGTLESKNTSMCISYHTGLPLVNAFLSRPSSSESMQIAQLFRPPGKNKSYLDKLHSNKPFLVICTNEELPEDEQALLKNANEIYKNPHIRMYELKIKDLQIAGQ